MEDIEAAIPAYQKAFTLEPAAIFGTFINHEYGFTLIRAGRLAEAEAVFGRMKREGELHAKAKGHRSRAASDVSRRCASATKISAARSCSIRATKRRSVSSAIECTW
jgi:hypothetical protein